MTRPRPVALYGPLEALIGYSRAPATRAPTGGATAGETSIDDILQEKVAWLARMIGLVEEDIGRRRTLSRRLAYRICQHYLYLKAKLYQIELWPLNTTRTIGDRRSRLEQQLDALQQEARAEEVECWRDVTKLRSELRAWLEKYGGLVTRARLLSSGKTD